ncbi:hypothetical protein JCM5353_000812 [Sporobolomyces roseus]
MSSISLEADQAIHESDPAVSFLRSAYPSQLFSPPSIPPEDLQDRAFVTLTYAQSFDAKIAGKEGKQLILSGKESMQLTHRMRELHDSILVGSGTLLNDDPQLNARIPSLLPVSSQPTPIILDRMLRTPLDCKLLKNAQAGIGKAPVIVARTSQHPQAWFDVDQQQRALEAAGATVIRVDIKKGELPTFTAQTAVLSLSSSAANLGGAGFTLASLVNSKALRPHLGRSLMIEGGASVISSFLAAPEVDMIITTVAPTFVGSDGVDLLKPGTRVPQTEHVKTQIFGRDTVFACKPMRKE